MDNNKIKEMILELVSEIDYDIYKNVYNEETAEFTYPGAVEENIQVLVDIVKTFLGETE